MKHHRTLHLTPDGQYSRHSEGAFIRLRDGGILFVYSRFTENAGDGAPCDLVALRSYDEGETWKEPLVLLSARERHGVRNIMSVSLMRMRSGALGVFYLVKQVPDVTTKIYLALSEDEGETFSRFIDCTQNASHGYYVMNNQRAERLSSGRILLPAAFHRVIGDGVHSSSCEQRSFCTFLYSDDDGSSWQESHDTVFPPFPHAAGLQEPGIIELKNGVLWAYYRTDVMMQYENFSLDGGLHWTVPQPSRFSSPLSPMKIARRPDNDWLYAVWNPIPNYCGRQTPYGVWGRTPLVYAVSQNDGLDWSDPVILEDSPTHGYCYPALFFTRDSSLLISYCCGGEKNICLSETAITKVPLEP